MKDKNKKIATVFAIIGAFSLIAACSLSIHEFIRNSEAQDTMEEIRASSVISSEAESSVTESQPESGLDSSEEFCETSAITEVETVEPEPEIVLVDHPYKEQFQSNPDMAAWIQIPDTRIDYPVMWTPRDEQYYLYRDFNGNENKNGCLILDTDSCLDPLSTNLIIHGHNMKSGEMFGNLTDYENPDYYQNHKYITLYTPQCQRNYEVIAVFRSQVFKKTDNVFKFYKFFQADTQEEFDDFYTNIKSMSQYDTGVTAQFGDHFLTLSTCVYHVKQGRFVVVAKEIDSGDYYLPIQE